MTTRPPVPRLYINHVAEHDWLIALEFGRVDDAQPPDNWRGISEQFGYLHEEPGGRCLGFKVLDISDFDAEGTDVREIWDVPHFDVPLLGLRDASAGEIVIATRVLLGNEPTVNRCYFDAATAEEDPRKALGYWICCLESGDSMAHFGLGYTLYGLDRYQEAYRHLRHYTEIAPHGAWNWCWYGKAAEKVGELAEARRAYERAIELAGEGDQETDTAALLQRLEW